MRAWLNQAVRLGRLGREMPSPCGPGVVLRAGAYGCSDSERPTTSTPQSAVRAPPGRNATFAFLRRGA
jgi:hypothetical protein